MYNVNHMDTTKELIAFLESCPTAFHAAAQVSRRLEEAGFVCLQENEKWELLPGHGYYVTRNNSSLIAFAIPDNPYPGLQLTASHSDSPAFKLKNEPETGAFEKYTKLSVEGYGGMIYTSWFDRPLSVAGRLILARDGEIVARTVYVNRDLVLIPNVAVHQMRSLNSGFTPNPAVDLLPLFGGKNAKLIPVIAEAAGVEESEIIGADLFLVNRTPGCIWGMDNAFFSAPRIDNLQSVYSTLMGFLSAGIRKEGSIGVYSMFDNEETGSATKQGAGSLFLRDTLTRLCESMGMDLRQVLASSFLVSADNGHAQHPNHPELSDSRNCPHMNEGVVIKVNAAQKYTTDGLSAALFREICRRAEVPVQYFHNRSDMPGGSTLGSIANTTVAAYTVDIGLAQLAMHSAYETAGTADTSHMIRAIEKFYSLSLTTTGDGRVRLV